ncbi:MAG: hypothetical protein HOV80_24310 [Polyangiaceae bacterium]|nr:hypothetical protein [Polyangiaceae bacterium]
MDAPRYDENGWRIDLVRPLARAAAFTLFATEPSARLETAVLEPAARAIGLALTVDPLKAYPHDTAPLSDAAILRAVLDGDSFAVDVRTFPIDRGLALRTEAIDVATSKGGAGMDSLVKRARRIWQIDIAPSERAALAIAAVLSSVHLAAIMPPAEGPIFGPKTARERLEA